MDKRSAADLKKNKDQVFPLPINKKCASGSGGLKNSTLVIRHQSHITKVFAPTRSRGDNKRLTKLSKES